MNGVQAVVHDSVVTLFEVQRHGFGGGGGALPPVPPQPEVLLKKLSDAREESLGQLIERQLILHDFKVTFSQPERQAIVDKEINKEVDQELEAEIRTRTGGNRMIYIQTLQAEGITLERRRQIIRDRIIITWLRQKNITSELIVSPHRVEVYYLAHREEFKVQEEVKLRMIVLKCPGDNEVAKTEKLAEDILRALKEGAPLPRWQRFIRGFATQPGRGYGLVGALPPEQGPGGHGGFSASGTAQRRDEPFRRG